MIEKRNPMKPVPATAVLPLRNAEDSEEKFISLSACLY